MRDKIEFSSKELKIKIQGEELISTRSGEVYKFGVREFSKDGGLKSASSTGKLEENEIEKLLEQSKALGLNGKLQVPTGNFSKSWEYGEEASITYIELAKEAQSHIDRFKKELPQFVIQGFIKTSDESVKYTHSQNSELSKNFKNFTFMYDIRRKGSPHISDAFLAYEDVQGFNAEEFFEFNLSLLKVFDEQVKVDSGKYKVLMAPDWSMTRKIGESLRADMYHEDSALYSGKMNKSVFDQRVNFSDFKDCPVLGGVNPFDYEGSVFDGDRLPLIREGKLVGLISDLKNQSRYGVKSTANGFRSYNSQVGLSFSRLGLEKGKRSVFDILKDHDQVIVSLLAAGGDVTEEGHFSSPIQLSFLVENGKPVGRLNNLSMVSSLDQFFGSHLLEISSTPAFGSGSDPYCLVEAEFQAT